MHLMLRQTDDEQAHNRRKRSREELLASVSGLDSSLWELKLRDCGLRDSDLEIFRRLSSASTDRNIFFDPAFFAASHQRLGLRIKKLITLTEKLGDTEEMKLAFPVQLEKVGFPARPVLRVWSHIYGPLSTPLLEPVDDESIVDVLVQCLAQIETSQWKAIVFQDVPVHSRFVKLLRENAPKSGAVRIANHSKRAMLLPQNPDQYLSSNLKKKRRKDLARLTRRLETFGTFEFEVVTDLMGCLLRYEEFLLLETRSWKGRKGTSLHMIKKTAAFARQAISNLVAEDACRIYSLRIDDVAIASTIVFRSQGWYFPWKIAHNEDFNKYSVGKILLANVTTDLLAIQGFSGADSLAAPDNAMINQLWPDRREMADVILGTGDNGSKNAINILKSLNRSNAFKQKIKSLLGR